MQLFLSDLKNQFLADPIDLVVVGIAYNRRAALEQLKNTQVDLLLIDLMLPGMRSVEIIAFACGTQSDVKILALTPGDPPHDRVIMATQAGALGFVSKDAESAEIYDGVRTVLRGEHYLPLEETFDVLQQAAPEMIASVKERRAQFFQVVVGIIPIAGILSAFTAFLWREYWGKIGVRVADLGVDASSRVTEVLVALLVMLGILGPLLFIRTWMRVIGTWIEDRPRVDSAIAVAQKKMGRVLLGWRAGWLAIAIVALAITVALQTFGETILTAFLGALIFVVLLGNFVAMSDLLPVWLRFTKEETKHAMVILGGSILALMLVLSVEVFLRGPDLRHDGLHGFLAPTVLDLSARPVVIYDLDEKHKPLGVLYLGGNADLYVLYDPFKNTVRFIPVGSSRVEFVDELQPPSNP